MGRWSRSMPSLPPSWLTELAHGAQRAGAYVEVREVVAGATAQMLAARAARARLLVLGSYGQGVEDGDARGLGRTSVDR